MSSVWGKVKYDECAYRQDVKMSIEPGMYNVYTSRFENDLGTFPNVDSCGDDIRKRVACAPCNLNKDANINNNFKALSNQLLDIDSELKLYVPQLSKCGEKKYQAGYLEPQKKKNIVVTPNLCDRSIVPSNMVPLSNSGLKYDF